MEPVADHNIQKIEIKNKVKCSTEEFYGLLTHKAHEIPKYLPHIYPSVEVIGDGMSLGSIFIWNYLQGGRSKIAKERVTAVDHKNMSITYSVFEGDLLNDYKSFDFKLAITPKVDGMNSLVKWTVEYEKANDDVPPPIPIMKMLEMTTTEADQHLLKQAVA